MNHPPAEENLSSSPLNLHAEYLPNIRQVSLQIALPRSADPTPQISLSESRRAVTVSVSASRSENGYGISETIKLPARVAPSSARILSARRAENGMTTGTRELSYRMQVDDDVTQRSPVDELMDSFVPWAAGDMSGFTKLRCRRCDGVILDEPASASASAPPESDKEKWGWIWKDLPSGNWAEMMDFWHCHKPDPPEDHGSGGAPRQVEDVNSNIKGYGASNQVLASPGTVLVDVATFLVSEQECKGVEKDSEELICKCGALIGVEDPVAKGRRLFKTSLSAGSPSTEDDGETSWESHPAELVVAAQLLELIERESARRFIVHCGNADGLLIWVFNPDMRYSTSSSEHSITSQRAMKIFFQVTHKAEDMLHPEPGKTSSLSMEELRLPKDTFNGLSNALEASNGMLPQSARTFQREWRVGILPRLERTKRQS
ncbi:ubiquitin-conjugating enzyme E2-binding protein [Aspergillus egyptiacus]|nr:ubiquitin-conjugating enzyme E2-binding protein [Aspergillus egyptiacus]